MSEYGFEGGYKQKGSRRSGKGRLRVRGEGNNVRHSRHEKTYKIYCSDGVSNHVVIDETSVKYKVTFFFIRV